jgi:hypothetical protein
VHEQLRQDCQAVGQMMNVDRGGKKEEGKRKIWVKKRK